MDTQKRLKRFERNPITHAAHKREAFWQIFMPLLMGILLILAAMGAIIFQAIQPVSEVGRWASVSLIWLILPTLFLAMLLLALLVGLIYFASMIMSRVPRYALIIQLYITQAKNTADHLLNASTEPILRINSIWASIRYATGRGKRPV